MNEITTHIYDWTNNRMGNWFIFKRVILNAEKKKIHFHAVSSYKQTRYYTNGNSTTVDTTPSIKRGIIIIEFVVNYALCYTVIIFYRLSVDSKCILLKEKYENVAPDNSGVNETLLYLYSRTPGTSVVTSTLLRGIFIYYFTVDISNIERTIPDIVLTCP